MEAMGAFFEMGGYARFVWPSFALTFVVMIGLWLASRHALAKSEAVLADLQAATGTARQRRKMAEVGDET